MQFWDLALMCQAAKFFFLRNVTKQSRVREEAIQVKVRKFGKQSSRHLHLHASAFFDVILWRVTEAQMTFFNSFCIQWKSP
jgi:hypothetical protein